MNPFIWLWNNATGAMATLTANMAIRAMTPAGIDPITGGALGGVYGPAELGGPTAAEIRAHAKPVHKVGSWVLAAAMGLGLFVALLWLWKKWRRRK